MIKLIKYRNQNQFVETYLEDKCNEVCKRYEKMTPKEKGHLGFLFPEAFCEMRIEKTFIYDLLSKSLYEVIDKYPSVKFYFDIAFFSSINIIDICKGRSKKEANLIRKKYCQKYFSYLDEEKRNILLEYYSGALKAEDVEDYICKSEKNFKDFQKYVRNRIVHSKRIRKGKIRYGIISKLIDYDMVSRTDKSNIVSDLDISVCPYCNRAYISNFEDSTNKEERTTADIDHFFSKNCFGLFAISLYNFVPSCKVCNSLFKLDKNMDIMYPYEDAYEQDAKFTLIDSARILTASEVYGWSKGKKIDIKLTGGNYSDRSEQIEREIQLFRIREVYQVHNEFAERLLYSKNVLGGEVKEEILKCINEKIPDNEKLEEDDFNKFFYGIDTRNIRRDRRKELLAKLIDDILN